MTEHKLLIKDYLITKMRKKRFYRYYKYLKNSFYKALLLKLK